MQKLCRTAIALLYTLVRNCRIHDIDPEIYPAEAIRGIDRKSDQRRSGRADAVEDRTVAALRRPLRRRVDG